jgi:hypothetical protein
MMREYCSYNYKIVRSFNRTLLLLCIISNEYDDSMFENTKRYSTLQQVYGIIEDIRVQCAPIPVEVLY